MKQIQSKKCKEHFNLLKSRVYNDYPLCKKLKKQTNKHYQKTNPKTKTSNKTAKYFKMSVCQFILPSFSTTRRGFGGGENDMKIQQQTFRTFLVFLIVKVHVTENE